MRQTLLPYEEYFMNINCVHYVTLPKKSKDFDVKFKLMLTTDSPVVTGY